MDEEAYEIALTESELRALYRLFWSRPESNALAALQEGVRGWNLEELAAGGGFPPADVRALRAIREKLRQAVPARRRAGWEEDIRLESMAQSAFYVRAPLPTGVARALEKGLKEHRTIEARYFSHGRGVAATRRLDIYGRRRDYYVAYCHLTDKVKKFRADRFLRVYLTEERYTIPANFDIREYG